MTQCSRMAHRRRLHKHRRGHTPCRTCPHTGRPVQSHRTQRRPGRLHRWHRGLGRLARCLCSHTRPAAGAASRYLSQSHPPQSQSPRTQPQRGPPAATASPAPDLTAGSGPADKPTLLLPRRRGSTRGGEQGGWRPRQVRLGQIRGAQGSVPQHTLPRSARRTCATHRPSTGTVSPLPYTILFIVLVLGCTRYGRILPIYYSNSMESVFDESRPVLGSR